MKISLTFPNRSMSGWLAYVAVAVALFAYFTLTSISLITYVLLGSVLLFSYSNGSLGRIMSTRYFSYSVLLLVYVFAVIEFGPEASSTMPEAIIYQMLVCLAFFIFVVADQRGINSFLMLISLSVLVFCVMILNDNELRETIQQANEVGAYYSYMENNRNTVGILLSIGALCMLHFGVSKNRIWFVGMIVAIVLGLITGSRKVVFTVAIGAILYAIMYNSFVQEQSVSKKRLTVLFVLLAVVAMLYACFEIPELYNIIGSRLEGMFEDYQKTGKLETSARVRNEMIDRALQMFKEKPFFGWGIDGFEKYGGYRGAYSHNNYTETLVSFGIVGFLLMYVYKFILIILHFNLIRKEKDKKQVAQHVATFVLMIASLVMDYAAVSMNSVVLSLSFSIAAAEQYCYKFKEEVTQ